MKKISCILLAVLTYLNSFGQSKADKLNETPEIIFTIRNDTLISETGVKIFIGQKLIIGKGSGENGRYQSLSFKSPFALPLILFRKSEINNNPEYQNNPGERDLDKVKESLNPGEKLTILKIDSKGKNQAWQYFNVYLENTTTGSKYRSTFPFALNLRELIVPEQ